MGNLEHALSAYENALRHNPMSLAGLTQVAGIARIKENYPKVSNELANIPALPKETFGSLSHARRSVIHRLPFMALYIISDQHP